MERALVKEALELRRQTTWRAEAKSDCEMSSAQLTNRCRNVLPAGARSDGAAAAPLLDHWPSQAYLKLAKETQKKVTASKRWSSSVNEKRDSPGLIR